MKEKYFSWKHSEKKLETGDDLKNNNNFQKLLKIFFFENAFFRAMWVYSASTKIDEYLSIIHVEKEDLKLNWSGPVQDLKLHKSQVSF